MAWVSNPLLATNMSSVRSVQQRGRVASCDYVLGTLYMGIKDFDSTCVTFTLFCRSFRSHNVQGVVIGHVDPVHAACDI